MLSNFAAGALEKRQRRLKCLSANERVLGRLSDDIRSAREMRSNRMNNDLRAADELDLAVPDMRTEDDVSRGSVTLATLRGVVAVRLLERGAFVRYRPAVISEHEISDALRKVGFGAKTSQDSEAGNTDKR